MGKIKDAMERGDYPIEKRDRCDSWEPNGSVERTDEDDDSADEEYERSKDEKDYFTRSYGHHEE